MHVVAFGGVMCGWDGVGCVDGVLLCGCMLEMMVSVMVKSHHRIHLWYLTQTTKMRTRISHYKLCEIDLQTRAARKRTTTRPHATHA